MNCCSAETLLYKAPTREDENTLHTQRSQHRTSVFLTNSAMDSLSVPRIRERGLHRLCTYAPAALNWILRHVNKSLAPTLFGCPQCSVLSHLEPEVGDALNFARQHRQDTFQTALRILCDGRRVMCELRKNGFRSPYRVSSHESNSVLDKSHFWSCAPLLKEKLLHLNVSCLPNRFLSHDDAHCCRGVTFRLPSVGV